MTEILDCTFTHWQPGIGDPSWQGWATVALYLVVSGLALRTAGQGKFPPSTFRRERIFWIVTAVMLALLAVNKQLGLQSALTAAGRCSATAQGWYQQRRVVQLSFLLALAAVALLFLGTMLALMRGTLRRTTLAAIGIAVVLGFVLMRAVGFHHFDRMLGVPVLGVRANMVMEWIGPCLIAGGSVLGRRRMSR